MTSRISKHIFCVFCALLLTLPCLKPLQAQEEEKTYSISLVKKAEIEQDIYEVDDKKVLTEEYTIRDGDHVWQLLRARGLLKRRNLNELLSALKQLNSSLGNLDLVQPGEKIIIPLKIVPISGSLPTKEASKEKVVSIEALKDLKFENYTVKPGDSVIRVVKGLYDVPQRDLHNEYLNLVKKLNPSIKDLNIIYPHQIIRLPIYTPEIVRRPIERVVPPKPEEAGKEEKVVQELSPIAPDLRKIFSEMGEEWVQTGEHFIPLKSGGQIDLKAESFPIINFTEGLRLIVDLNNKLPVKMAELIESSWGNYRVVHLVKGDDLRSSLDKILKACNYPKLFKPGEPLELEGDIDLSITGDWIVTPSETPSDNRPGVFVINLKDSQTPGIPQMIKHYLKGLGIKVIDYPPGDESTSTDSEEVQKLKGGADPPSLINTLLSLTGQKFSTQVEIPVYQSQKADFALTLKADFFMNIQGRDAIIDITGLGPEMISLLKEHQFLILSLAAEKDPLAMVAKTLEFLNVQFNSGPHSFTAIPANNSKNIKLTLPGIVFYDSQGKSILATRLNLPDEIGAFLSQKGYGILPLSFS